MIQELGALALFTRFFLSNSWGSGRRPQNRRQATTQKGPRKAYKPSTKAIVIIILLCLVALGALIGFQAYLNSRTCEVTGQPLWGWSC